MTRLGNLDRWLHTMRDELAALELPQAVEDRFGPYRNNPVGFCTEVLGVESAQRRSNAQPYQFRILEDVAEYPRVAVRSGHGVGKSAVNAWAALWWLSVGLDIPRSSRHQVLAPSRHRGSAT